MSRTLTTEVCPACESGYHEDQICAQLFKCSCPCHGGPVMNNFGALQSAINNRQQIADAVFCAALSDAIDKRVAELLTTADASRGMAGRLYAKAERLFTKALNCDYLLERGLA